MGTEGAEAWGQRPPHTPPPDSHPSCPQAKRPGRHKGQTGDGTDRHLGRPPTQGKPGPDTSCGAGYVCGLPSPPVWEEHS
ncbi:unnamed protein product [Gulo gulo]|uniref:Uncharacterized protein n=1 Tax=Gulo gulo TaxID=48420 RepID=A0A9X9LI24_GULGU|nr:unnamed protein product [Gulo gulo]